MRNAALVGVMILGLALALLAGCETSTEPDNQGSPADSVTVFIDAATGGVINLTGIATGVSLTIPPGAMAESGEISAIATDGPSPGRLQLRFEPQGLQFSQPVRLSVPIPAAKGNDVDDLIALFKLVLTQPDMWSTGSELTGLTALAEVARWSSDTIEAEMEHLHKVLLFSWRVSYLVVDIPGKYLRPGDGLFVMSGDATGYQYRWLPGHVGMVGYANPDSANMTVVESTIGGPPPQGDGVQTNDLLRFKRTSNHLYLGARRPPGALLNDDSRQAAVQNAYSHLGEGYAYLGGNFGGYNCTGLLEEAWDTIGRGVMTANYEFMYPTEMYNATVPITEITVKAGEELRIPVYPAVIATSSANPALSSHFLAGNHTSATVTASGLPDGATWAVDTTLPYLPQVMSWTPRVATVDTTIRITFTMTGVATTRFGPPYSYTNTQSLAITVLGKSRLFTVYPVGRGSLGNSINISFELPPGAVVGEPSTEHLIDVATGQYPVSDVFTNQVFDNYTEGWLTAPYEAYYGASMHITRSDVWGTTPTGSHTWQYSIGYTLPRYFGIR